MLDESWAHDSIDSSVISLDDLDFLFNRLY